MSEEFEVEVSVELPEDKPVEEVKPKKRTSKADKVHNPYTDILKFVGLASLAKGGKHVSHCSVKNGWIIATNSIITMGHPIDLSADFNPLFSTLSSLLKEYPRAFDITVNKVDSAVFSSGNFVGTIPCISDEEMNIASPDTLWGNIDDGIASSLSVCLSILKLKNDDVYTNCISLDNNVATAFNGRDVIQKWHGWSLPTKALIPSECAKILGKIKKNLTGIGYGVTDKLDSVTFYFNDGSWLKTNVYAEVYPDYFEVFNEATSECLDIPSNFFKNIHMLRSLSTEDVLFIRGDILSNYPNDESGSRFTIPNLSDADVRGVFSYTSLCFAESNDFHSCCFTDKYALFLGTSTRLFISAIPLNKVNL